MNNKQPGGEQSYSEAKDDAFARSVAAGLRAQPKSLSSKYFYDSEGDQLFTEIMDLPEYYLTRAEYQILEDNRKNIVSPFVATHNKMSLVELGAGDGKKTRLLLDQLRLDKADFKYMPVDISANALKLLKTALSSEYPGLEITEICKDYFDAMQLLKSDFTPKLVLLLGSNIGNFSRPEAENFLQLLRSKLNFHDQLLVGFDLKKNPHTVYRAYSDSQGVTSEFNFNLLRRINQELGANFDLDGFMHYPTYDPSTGEMKSFLLSTRSQKVFIKALKSEISFDAWEPIFTEVSMKYSLKEITQLAERCGLVVEEIFTDSHEFYVDVLLRKKDSMRDAHHPKN